MKVIYGALAMATGLNAIIAAFVLSQISAVRTDLRDLQIGSAALKLSPSDIKPDHAPQYDQLDAAISAHFDGVANSIKDVNEKTEVISSNVIDSHLESTTRFQEIERAMRAIYSKLDDSQTQLTLLDSEISGLESTIQRLEFQVSELGNQIEDRSALRRR